ncbi:hypothetical protein B0I72DRAFT_133474 [Yarrowia lipolytica]|uniref:RNA helicase n=2 Tax=Yarrowia lipolytica TaxID=4952 RepID=Q6CF17_YARLI|nr:YALI0B11066p [Yarrowia lipolytica CLIB122]AOW01534.1 hypothetical protein YALI1_B14752g [Yarrowia lipolytica]KAB8281106.1 hypothetical protein BKA91DRAFT_140808 [Yarrowia lipolytica]KAE8170336.1 hypothetical protein BKA90DRAFT_141059 [Yarrowia lipolytica]KAJ8052350.1 hypothetical protein LXG23DRAFT_50389 [Yarrowia lipolytica]RDW35172.1 hypothetical protein B0I72DRAFT_133474 [Yarrowia lipolytica]|eukprot:XP_500745.1 YALI0B11066p [Yarrowia lipolytica CLIB122]
MWRTSIQSRQIIAKLPTRTSLTPLTLTRHYQTPSNGPQRSFKPGSRPKNASRPKNDYRPSKHTKGPQPKPRNSPRSKDKTAQRSKLPLNGPLKLNLQTPEIHLTVDHTKAKTWSDLKVPTNIASEISKAIESAVEPEYAQKQFLSIVNSDISLVWNSLPGCGVSTALDIALLSKPERINVRNATNPRDYGVNHLLIVSSELAGKQHLKRLLEISKANTRNGEDKAKTEGYMAQLLYRASPEAEKEQLALLRKAPSPQVLITTPTRLMDILQSDFRDRLNLKQLSSIFVDDADVLLPQEKFILKTKTQKINNHTKPIIELGDYIASLRNGYMRSELLEFPPLQIVWAGATLKSFHKRLLTSLGWSEGRPVVDIGLTHHNLVKAPYSVTSPDVDVRIVSKPTRKSPCTNVVLPPINLGLAMEELQDVLSISRDRGEYLKMKFAAIRDFYNDRYTQVMRKRFYNKQLFLDKSYFEAASDLIRSRPKERALVLTTQSFKADKYKDAFAEVGINAAHVADLDPSRMDDFCQTFFSTPIDPSNDATQDMPEAIVCNLRQFKGIQLPGLSNVIVLGWESLEEESDFALIANMCNTKESIKARNDDEYKATARGQMSVILDSEDSHDEVLLERIAYTVAKAGVELDETDVVVRAAENMKGKKMEKQLSEEPKKPKRLGKKKAAIAERKAAREATAKAKESGVGGGDIASESSDTMDSKPELSNVTGPTSESQTRSDSTDPTSTSESSSGSEPSQQKQSA